ncbi:peptidylprolyl isomerase [Geminicoccus roseus]|uniref:peptidylprolyl isomerase n=1 Tax=Geminicoccus roseus TaxID=404900 RepID=UPI0009FD1CCF|nr:peptidylprolyl isomerase [Geminicoccus roseus]
MSRQTILDRHPSPATPTPVMPSACATGGCGGAPADARLRPAPPSFGAVAVNGVEIEPEAIALEIQHHPSPDGEAAWRQAARALVVRELFLQEARRLGIEPDPEEDDAGRSETLDDAVIRALLERQIEPNLVGAEECRRYYEGHVHRFRTPELFEASHILIEPDGDDAAAWAAAEAEARAIAAEVGDDPGAFAEAARAFSKCPSAHQEGSLGQVRRGELVAVVQEALEALPEGTAGREPARSRFGWHVLRLQRRIAGHTLPFEMVKDRIADMLEARAWATSAALYTAELAGSAEIEGVVIDPATGGAA